MVRVQWDSINDAVLPVGQYKFQIVDAEVKITKNNDEMWALKLEVSEGERIGVKVYDNVTFNKVGLSRVKMLYKCIGYETEGIEEVELETDQIIGKEVIANVDTEKYTDKNGKEKRKNIIPFDGFRTY